MRVSCWILLASSLLPGAARASAQQSRPTSAASQALAEDLSPAEMLAQAQKAKDELRLDVALQMVNQVLQRNKTDMDALALRGEIELAIGDALSARKDFQAIYESQKNDFRANLGLGRIYLAASYARQAIGYLEAAVKVAPPARQSEAATLLARAYRGGNRQADALRTAKAVVDADPSSYEATMLLTALFADVGDVDRGLSYSQRLIDVANGSFSREPASLQSLQRLDAAYAQRLDVLRRMRDNLFMRGVDGVLTDRIAPGNEQKAAAVFEEVATLSITRARLQLTMTYHDTISFAQRAVDLEPGNVAYLTQLAQLEEAIYNFDKAGEHYRKVLEIEPSNQVATDALRNLSQRPSSAPASMSSGSRPVAQERR